MVSRFLIISLLVILACLGVLFILEATALNFSVFIGEGEGYVTVTADTSSYITVKDASGKILHTTYLSHGDIWNISLPEGIYIIEGRPAGLSPIPYSSTSVRVTVRSGEYYHIHLSYSYSVLFISLIAGVPTLLVSIITYFSISGRRKKYLKKLENLIERLENLSDKVEELSISDIIERYNKLLNNAKSLEGEKSTRELSQRINYLEEEYSDLEKTIEEYYEKLMEYQNLKKQVLERIDKLVSSINDLMGSKS